MMMKIERPTGKQILSWTGQLLLMLALWVGISYWQQKDLLKGAEMVPGFTLTSLDGQTLRLEEVQAERTLLYFFAPWCGICKLSIGNLNELQRAQPDSSLAVLAIGLSYNSTDEIRAFVGEEALEVPVLLGTPKTLNDYRIEMFPTYYVLDEEKRVISKAVGYSTEFGLKARSWW